jgi:conjugative relaxase-like TrwC/TraI family protein
MFYASSVLIVRGIGQDSVSYYTHGGGRAGSGRWWGQGCAALGLAGEVDAGDLRRILQGRHPGDGRFLPAQRPARRRAGWDLVFAAPKSVSLLWALQPDGPGAESIAAAHRRSVEGTLGHLEVSMLTIKRAGAPGGREPSRGAVAAVFDHLTNAASEPHLHTHALLANLGQAGDGHWAAVSGSHWRVCREGLFALYQLELRHHLERAGMDLPWRIHPGGTADLADVPRAAIRAASTQRWSAAAMGRIEARRQASAQPWRERSAQSGFGADDALWMSRAPRARADPGWDGLTAAVTDKLLARRSDFRMADVWTALAACHPGGMTAAAATRWSAGFCAQAAEVKTARSTPRWTTGPARAADERLLRESVWQPQRGNAGPEIAAEVVREAGLPDAATRAVHRLVTSDRTLEIISAPPGVSGLLERAEVLGAATRAWHAAGLRVAVTCRRPADALRWQTLIGVEPYRPGRAVDILIVDQAERWPTTDLHPIFASARAAGARAVLVEGGTLPRLSDPASRAFVELCARHSPVELACPAPALQIEPLRRLVEVWARENLATVTLVGLGPDEVEGLNRLARAERQAAGALGSPPEVAAGREYRPGDRVASLRAGRVLPPRGTLGTVIGLSHRPDGIRVEWAGGERSVVAGPEVKALRHGYAATPGLAARIGTPLLLLGPGDAVPSLASRIIGSVRPGVGVELDAVRWRRDAPAREGMGLGL